MKVPLQTSISNVLSSLAKGVYKVRRRDDAYSVYRIITALEGAVTIDRHHTW